MTRPEAIHDTLAALGRDVVATIEEPSADALARQRARLLASAHTRRSSRRYVLAVAAGLAAATALVVVARRPARSPQVLSARVGARSLRAGEWVAAGRDPMELWFSDGSRVLLSPGTHARVESFEASGARVLIERGGAEASVHHGPRSAWRFAAGPYTVDVTGTRFSLAWEPSAGRFDLAMQAGRVVLKGPRCVEGVAVRDRDEVHADVVAQTLTLGPLAHVAVALGPTPQVPIPVTASAHVSAGPAVHRERRAPDEERVAHATAPEVSATIDAAAMLREADALRGMRRRELLLDLRRRFAAAPEASHAAFELGVLSLDTFGAPAEALRWFDVYLREAPDGPFAHEARGRRVQALHAAGDDVAARAAAARYLEQDADGPFAPFARGILGR